MCERNNSFYELAMNRYSVRKFDDRRVGRDIVNRILEAGRRAPTACNRQPQRILVIDSDEALEKLRRCTMSHFNCKLAMLICFDRGECWKREYDGKTSGDIDASIVTTHMMLEAFSLGIGSTWVMHFIPEAIREEFSLPDNLEAVSLLVMGYPAPDAKPYPGHLIKKELSETVYDNCFDIPYKINT